MCVLCAYISEATVVSGERDMRESEERGRERERWWGWRVL